MLCFPNAKINLGLCITRRRPDGYHDLQTVFYPVRIGDALEVHIKELETGTCAKEVQSETCTKKSQSGTSAKEETSDTGTKVQGPKCLLRRHGLPLDGDPQDDLVVRAYRLLDKLYGLPPHGLPPVEVDLLKGIPSGAGLGGGSADAAFMLRALNELCQLHLSTEELERHAATLGADCAVFIANRPVYAEGIGNVFTPVSLTLKGYGIEVVRPPVFVSTREAFAHIRPRMPKVPLLEVVQQPVDTWRATMVNDFEESVFPQYPIIASIKEEMYSKGAIYAAMTGSGSSVFGLFSPGVDWPTSTYPEGSFVYRGVLE